MLAGAALRAAFPFSEGREHRQRTAGIIDAVPWDFQRWAARELAARLRDDRAAGWTWADSLPAMFVQDGVPVDADDDRIDQRAQRLTRDAMREVARWSLAEPADRLEALRAWALERGAVLPPDVLPEGAAARVQDVAYWRRLLRVAVGRAYEGRAQAAGFVHRKVGAYASGHTLQRWRGRQKANAAMLGRMIAESDAGDVVTLAEASAATVANPVNRRSEFFVRARGFEAVAQAAGHAALFLTITTPSRFHRMRHDGTPNPKWSGATPREAQAYLSGVWARIRAAWARAGVAPYGFRVAEPHHDGTPHWHVLLWMPEDAVGRFDAARWFDRRAQVGAVGIAGFYARQADGDEPGADRHRFDVERIDPERGSAVGYLAAYIGKNIDGRRADGSVIDGGDLEAETTTDDGADRARAWASRWGVRQFQQVGGPSVTVWRELRRVRDTVQLDLFERVRSAADAGEWGRYVDAMGGPILPRRQRPVRLVMGIVPTRYGDTRERVEGLCGYSAQGSPADGIVPAGVRLLMHTLPTREKVWTVRRAPDPTRSGPRTRVNNCTGRGDDPQDDDGWRDGLAPPWWSEAPPVGTYPVDGPPIERG
jgi:hypothetical protein